VTIYNLYDDASVVAGPAAQDSQPVTLGTEFDVTGPVWLTQMRWIRPTDENTGQVRVGAIFQQIPGYNAGTIIAGPFDLPTPAQGQWGDYTLPTPVQLPVGTYRAVVYHPAGVYFAQSHWFDTGPNANSIVRGPISIPSRDNAYAQTQGSYIYGTGIQWPTNTFNATAYFPGATFSDVDPNVASVTLKRLESGLWATHPAQPKVFHNSGWSSYHPKYWNGSSWIGI
jgi:hypothetical protein